MPGFSVGGFVVTPANIGGRENRLILPRCRFCREHYTLPFSPHREALSLLSRPLEMTYQYRDLSMKTRSTNYGRDANTPLSTDKGRDSHKPRVVIRRMPWGDIYLAGDDAQK